VPGHFVTHALALSSGTAALHLALMLAGVGPGDEVLVSTLTFSASANPVVYLGARPAFIDSERVSWNMDPNLLADALAARARRNRLPRAVVLVHLYGQSADIDPIRALCDRYGVPLIEDAAEALGATYRDRAPIFTTSGGGALISDDAALIDRARFLATQARDPAPHYQHSEIGYNYRMSNVVAGVGRGQLEVLDLRVRQHREFNQWYRELLKDVPGVTFQSEPSPDFYSNFWLTCIVIDPAVRPRKTSPCV